MLSFQLYQSVWISMIYLGNAAGTLTSSPSATNGVLTLCPGVSLSFTCTHDNVGGGATRWSVTGITSQNCNRLVNHVPPVTEGDTCGPFTTTMISDDSGSTVTSTLQLAVVPETLDGAMVECLAGAGSSAESVGIIGIKVLDPTPLTSSVTYSVDTSTTGQLFITVVSPGAYGTGVTYSGSVVEGSTSGSVVANGNTLNVTGLDYSIIHAINFVGSSNVCPGLLRSNQTSYYVFNVAPPTISGLTTTLRCSDPSLPIILAWTVESGIQSTSDPTVPLNPPIITTPTISFKSVGSSLNSIRSTSFSPFTITNLTLDNVYIFNVSVQNIAGVASILLNGSRVAAFGVDDSTILNQGCVSIALRPECIEDVQDFSVTLTYVIGQCEDLMGIINFLSSTVTFTSLSSVCVSVGTTSSMEFCYTATLMYQNTVVMSQTNLDFRRCEVTTLEEQLGSGVTFTLSSPVDSSGTVPHSTIATLGCSNSAFMISEDTEVFCRNGIWDLIDNAVCSELSIAVRIALSVVLTFVLTLIVVVLIGVLSVLVVNKWRRSERKNETETEMRPPPAIYEEPEDFKPDPQTQENIAYGHHDVQF